MAPSAQISGIRTSPVCIAAATAVAVIAFCTALFFCTWRLVIDVHQYLSGIPMSMLGAHALMYLMVFVVFPIAAVALATCFDRCRPGWLACLTFVAAGAGTFFCIASPTLRCFLPVGMLGSGGNSSERWYWGALLQLVIAFVLLRYFPRAARGGSIK
jgi:hypothetical protein